MTHTPASHLPSLARPRDTRKRPVGVRRHPSTSDPDCSTRAGGLLGITFTVNQLS